MTNNMALSGLREDVILIKTILTTDGNNCYLCHTRDRGLHSF